MQRDQGDFLLLRLRVANKNAAEQLQTCSGIHKTNQGGFRMCEHNKGKSIKNRPVYSKFDTVEPLCYHYNLVGMSSKAASNTQ